MSSSPLRVMILVPTVPATLDARVPWHFFQDLLPMAKLGVHICVVSAVCPDYQMPGIEFRQLRPISARANPSAAASVCRYVLRHWRSLPTFRVRDAARLNRMCQSNMALLRLAREWNPDVIHSHWAFPAGSAAYLAAADLCVPLFMTLRGIEHNVLPEFNYGNCLDPFFERTVTKALQAVAKVSVQCSQTIERLRAMGCYRPETCETVFNGVDFTKWCRNRDGSTTRDAAISRSGTHETFVCVARMEDGLRKGHLVLLEAFRKLWERRGSIQLVLVGGGGDLPRWRHWVETQGLSSAVTFAGAVHPSDIPRYFHEAACSVMPSYSETFCNVVFESLAAGCPVISSDVGGPRDILPLGPFGYLFEPGNIDQLCDAMCRVLDDYPRALTMAAEGQEFVRTELTLEKRAAAFVRIYRELAERQ